MCGRYILYSDKEQAEMMKIVKEVNEKHHIDLKKGDIYPTNMAPVYAGTPDYSGKSLELMRWGYKVPWTKQTLINAKSETVFEKNTFKRDFMERRCLIPAVGFYEWGPHKEKFMFTSKDNELLYLGGIYTQDNVEGGQMDFVILTKSPIAPVAAIHNRMPVIISRDAAEVWLYDLNLSLTMIKDNPIGLDCISV